VDVNDAEEYTAALGQIVAGGYRQVALGVRLGVPEALDLTVGEWVEERLGGYVRLSIPERHAAERELVAEGMTQREVAEVLGVHEATVSRDLASASAGNGDLDVEADDLADASGEPSVDAVLDRAEAIADVLEIVKTERRPKPAPAPPAHPAAAFLWGRLGEVRDLDVSGANDDQRADITAAVDKWMDELQRLKGTP
jgi:transcriptional regulator with XRE-family HTH domain